MLTWLPVRFRATRGQQIAQQTIRSKRTVSEFSDQIALRYECKKDTCENRLYLHDCPRNKNVVCERNVVDKNLKSAVRIGDNAEYSDI